MAKVKANFELEIDDINYQIILDEIERNGYINIASYFITIRKIDNMEAKI